MKVTFAKFSLPHVKVTQAPKLTLLAYDQAKFSLQSLTRSSLESLARSLLITGRVVHHKLLYRQEG